MSIELSADQDEDATKMAETPDLPNFSLPGMGKTHTTLEAMARTGFRQHLVICPPIGLYWWQQQAEEYLGADARILKTGNSKLGGDVMITTYGIALNMQERLYEYFNEGTLTLDESHYVCNPEAKRTQAIFGKQADLAGGLAERFDTVWPLTGSPMRNFANDYYTQVASLHPDEFAAIGVHNYDDFCRKFTYKAQRQYNPRMQPVWKIVGSANEAQLGKIIYDDIGAIRRTTAEGMPKLRYRELWMDTKVPKEFRDAVKDKTDAEILAEWNNPDSIIAKVWKYSGLSKVPEVVPYVWDCYKASPILLGCWHHEVMDRYQEAFDKMGLRVERVDGSTPSTRHDSIRNAFNNGFVDVLIGQMQAMGESWNIQEASNHVIIAEEYPSPSRIDQFYKRVYRRGQERDCTVDIMLSKSIKVDETLNKVRKRKEESNDKIG